MTVLSFVETERKVRWYFFISLFPLKIWSETWKRTKKISYENVFVVFSCFTSYLQGKKRYEKISSNFSLRLDEKDKTFITVFSISLVNLKLRSCFWIAMFNHTFKNIHPKILILSDQLKIRWFCAFDLAITSIILI